MPIGLVLRQSPLEARVKELEGTLPDGPGEKTTPRSPHPQTKRCEQLSAATRRPRSTVMSPSCLLRFWAISKR
jgi:hypothetical protein